MYQNTTQTQLGCRFRVNLVENREGKSYGIAFVFVSNSAVYYMLLGKNPDGSDRIEYRDDPSWIDPVDGDNVNDAGWSTISAPVYNLNMNWGDICNEEDKLEVERNRHVCPKISFPLDPLMVLPPYRLTPEQIAERREKVIAENEGKKDFNPSLVEIPELAYFSVDRAMATPVDSKFMPHILKCKEIPSWITKEDIKAQFAPYVSDSKTPQERFIKGRRIEETYPFVNVNEDRVAFVIFDSKTHDAQFALHMMKKTIINKKMPNNTVETTTLIFNHSYRTDRDMMVDIGQKPRPVNASNQSRQGNQSNQSRSGPGQRRDNNQRSFSSRPSNKTTNKSSNQDGRLENKFAALSTIDDS